MQSCEVIKFQLFILKFFGILPAENPNIVQILWGITIFLWCGLVLVCCQAISVFYVETTNDLVEELLLLCTTTTITMKLTLFYLHRENLPNMLDILSELDRCIHNEGKAIAKIKEVYDRCNQTSTIYFVTYMGSIAALLLQLVLLERSERTWKSTTLVPTEFAQQPTVYYGVLVIEGFGNWLNCILAFALDTYCFLLIGLLAGHIEALSLHLSQFGFSKDTADQTESRKLRLLKHLEHYQLLDNYAKELNKHLSLVFFVQVSISAPVICTCAYQFSQFETLTNTQLMFLIPYSTAIIMQTFTPNYFATNVIENSELLPDRAFSSNWLGLDRNEKKAILLFMTRIMRPQVVCAGSLFQMNISTFLKITKSAYSLLAVLKSTQP